MVADASQEPIPDWLAGALTEPLAAVVQAAAEALGPSPPRLTKYRLNRADARRRWDVYEDGIDTQGLRVSQPHVSNELIDPFSVVFGRLDTKTHPIGLQSDLSSIVSRFIVPFVRTYFDGANSVDWDAQRFDRLLTQFVNELFAETTVSVLTTPIRNLRFDEGFQSPLSIDEGILLRGATSVDIEEWLSMTEHLLPRSQHFALAEVNVFIETEVEHEVGSPFTVFSGSQRRLNALVDALHIHCGPQVSPVFSYATSRRTLEPRASGIMSTTIPRFWGAPATLQLDASNTLRALYFRVLGEDGVSAATKLAIRRLSLSGTRASVEDRLIDYWVALEALFLRDMNQELSMRASQRIAVYLRDAGPGRAEVLDAMRLSYAWRSAVIHGVSPKAESKKDRLTLEQATERTEGYLRETLVRSLLTEPLTQSLASDLDARVFPRKS